MRIPLLCCSLVGLASLAFQAPTGDGSFAGRPEADAEPGAITTLYVHDPLLCSLDMRRGRPGLIVQQGEVRNADSHLSLGYYPDSLAVGVQGGDKGAIVDLGTLADVGKNAGVSLAGNGGNAFVELTGEWARSQTKQLELEMTAHAPIRSGHVYLARIVGTDQKELLTKLLVLEFRPGESVTLRWQQITD